jgi:hypothetical protein
MLVSFLLVVVCVFRFGLGLFVTVSNFRMQQIACLNIFHALSVCFVTSNSPPLRNQRNAAGSTSPKNIMERVSSGQYGWNLMICASEVTFSSRDVDA